VNALRKAGFAFHSGLHREKAEKMWADAVEEIKRRIKFPGGTSGGKAAPERINVLHDGGLSGHAKPT